MSSIVLNSGVILVSTGGGAALPCDLMPAQPGDSVYLVLWYKKKDKTPIYR